MRLKNLASQSEGKKGLSTRRFCQVLDVVKSCRVVRVDDGWR
jgi:hypothetical protein